RLLNSTKLLAPSSASATASEAVFHLSSGASLVNHGVLESDGRSVFQLLLDDDAAPADHGQPQVENFGQIRLSQGSFSAEGETGMPRLLQASTGGLLATSQSQLEDL